MLGPEISLLPVSETQYSPVLRPVRAAGPIVLPELRRSSLTFTKMFVDLIATPMLKTPRPTDAELSILRVLWQLGPSTVRQVHEVLMRDRPTAYTTALKLMQIMTEKGLVRRDESDRTHIYHPRLSQEQTQRQLIRDLMDRAFGGSSSKLVLQALASKRASSDELAEIRRMIEGGRDGSNDADKDSDREVRDERD